MLPDKFQFEMTGYFRKTHSIELRRGTLRHRQSESPFHKPVETKITPEPRQWEAFWQAVESAEVWQWQKEYLSDICDGTQWSLKLKLGDRGIDCSGSNAYPGATESDYDRSPQFLTWLRALRALTGHSIR